MTTSWATAPWLSIDCESTGVDPHNDRIVQLAAVTVHADGTISDPWCQIIDPGIDVPEVAAAIHGITTERARSEGVTPTVALKDLADRIYEVDTRTTPIVVFNARYDVPLILTEAVRHEVDVPMLAPYLDPFLIDRACDQYRRGSRKLTAVAEHYGVELGDEAHGALADAIASARVMRALAERFPEIATQSLATLWLRQVRWHETWRDGFVDFRRRNGDKAFDITPGWPIPVSTVVS